MDGQLSRCSMAALIPSQWPLLYWSKNLRVPRPGRKGSWGCKGCRCHMAGPADCTSCISASHQLPNCWKRDLRMRWCHVAGPAGCTSCIQLPISFQMAGRGISGCASLGARAGMNARAACAERLVLQAAASHQLPDCRKRDLRMRRPGREGRRECQGSLC